MKDQVVQNYDQHPPILKVSQPYFLEVSEVEFKDKNLHVLKNRLKQTLKSCIGKNYLIPETISYERENKISGDIWY